MRKQNVFLVTGHTPAGKLEQRVVCAKDATSVHGYVRSAFPDFRLVGSVSLASLEETAGQIKAALSGGAQELPVYVDPRLQQR
ncbi:hypothetical protein CBP36_21435 (plasmid) [Acidovorax carolinensis]|uniref:Uncharacterized protein n=1 Tax=Acidovorax carolinensis TaxID=553814 RepID=A0A240UKH9_9BURK|nr:hypothetical protein [Acidovorax carolinensis]ART61529.1 hypothetical protein CBP36_21435 [Acidovorax carolinensis]